MDLTLDEFREKIRGTEVECARCGYRAHALTQHLRTAHNLSAGQYRKDFPHAKLASRVVMEVLRRVGRDNPGSVDLGVLITPFLFDAEKGDAVEFEEFGKNFQVDPVLHELIPTADSFFAFSPNSKAIAFGVMRGKNIYLEGPTGCGKTEEVKQAFNRMGLPLRRVNMNGEVTPATFLGKMHMKVTGETYFDYGVLPKAMKEGVALLVDEVDYTPPHIAAVLHPAMEGDRTLFVPDTGEVIHAKEGFMVIATANTGGKGDQYGAYAGVEVLNTAFLDRYPIKLNYSYLSESVELDMLSRRFPKTQRVDITKMLAFAREARIAFAEGKIATSLSTRKLVEYFGIRQEFKTEEALDMVFYNWMDTDSRLLMKELQQRVGL